MLKNLNGINAKIFKANDIRGRYPEEIDERVVSLIAGVLKNKVFKKGKIIAAHDARLSSPALYKAVLKGLSYSDVLENLRMRIIPVGLATTPMFYFLVNHFKAVGGIMVTASHNPPHYNGLKAVGRRAEPLSGKDILKLFDFK